MNITEKGLAELREKIKNSPEISEKRRVHTLAVEDMAIRLGNLYCPEKLPVLRAAALLHDITKEYSTEKHIEICKAHGHTPERDELYAPKTFHARTAAYLIPSLYPEFADPEVISAVRWHTTGREGMTLTEKLIYLADYIDESRNFPDCVTLRHAFFDAEPEKMDMEARLAHLRDVLIISYNMTISALLEDGKLISRQTVLALNELIYEKLTATKEV